MKVRTQEPRLSVKARMLQAFARRLRHNQTDAEQRLWQRIRNQQVDGAKFRRQQRLGPYIVDFCCLERKLMVELDGGQHADHAQEDQRRTEFLEQEGYRVLRFWNHEILANLDAVLEQIAQALTPTPHPTLSPNGRGNSSPLGGEDRGEGGFTILELMIVLTIAGILLTLAEPSFSNTIHKAREASLKQNLYTMRDVIDQFRADTGKYPSSLADLKSAGYLKRIPVDPFTRSTSNWQEILDEAEGGVFDVHSGSDLVGSDGVPYNRW